MKQLLLCTLLVAMRVGYVSQLNGAVSPLPLFLHFIVPGYFAEGRDRVLPERIISTQVQLGHRFHVTVGKGDKAFEGRIETKDGKLQAHVQSVSFSSHNFDGEIKPEKIFRSQGGSIPAFFHAVYYALSTNSDPKGFLIQLEKEPEERWIRPNPNVGDPPPVMDLEKVPDGTYSVGLEWWGQKQNLTIRITDNQAQVIQSSEPLLGDMKAKFQQGNGGIFNIFFQTKDGQGASQLWIPQQDGSFIIKEIPDRSENQRAILKPKQL